MQKMNLSKLYDLISRDQINDILTILENEKQAILIDIMADMKYYDTQFKFAHFVRLYDPNLYLKIDAAYWMDREVGPCSQIRLVTKYFTETELNFYRELYALQHETGLIRFC